MPPPFKPPPNWRDLYKHLQRFRATTVAPVDTVGCNKLHDSSAAPETQRYQKLLALMLSSQTRDEITADAMRKLVLRGCTPNGIHALAESEVADMIHSVSFYNNKAKFIKRTTEIILDQYSGIVPRDYDALMALPGLGPKMVHLFLQEADDVVLGIGVDTHVHRIAKLFHWAPPDATSPEKTRQVLESWLPKTHWREVNVLLVGLGQTVCKARYPRCGDCALNGLCPSAFKDVSTTAADATTPPKRARSKRDSTKKHGSSAIVPDIEDTVPKHSSAKKKKTEKRSTRSVSV